MAEFDVYYVRADDKLPDHTIVEAAYLNEAAEYVEASKGGHVYKVEERGFTLPD